MLVGAMFFNTSVNWCHEFSVNIEHFLTMNFMGHVLIAVEKAHVGNPNT